MLGWKLIHVSKRGSWRGMASRLRLVWRNFGGARLCVELLWLSANEISLHCNAQFLDFTLHNPTCMVIHAFCINTKQYKSIAWKINLIHFGDVTWASWRLEVSMTRLFVPWWRHQMETFSALLAICAGNSPVTGEFPTKRPVTRGFDVFLDLHLNKQLSKQSWGWWFETPSRSLWRHCNATDCLGYTNEYILAPHYWPLVTDGVPRPNGH